MSRQHNIYCRELTELIVALFPVGTDNVQWHAQGTFDEIDSFLTGKLPGLLKKSVDNARIIMVRFFFPDIVDGDEGDNTISNHTYRFAVSALEHVGKDDVKPWVTRIELAGFLLAVLSDWIDDLNSRGSDALLQDKNTRIACQRAAVVRGEFEEIKDILQHGWVSSTVEIELPVYVSKV